MKMATQGPRGRRCLEFPCMRGKVSYRHSRSRIVARLGLLRSLGSRPVYKSELQGQKDLSYTPPKARLAIPHPCNRDHHQYRHKAGRRLLLPLEGPILGKLVSRSRSTTLSHPLAAMDSHSSSSKRTSAVTKPRQLAPTMGPAHGGVEFLEGALPGFQGYAIGRMTKSRRGKLYIDDSY